MAAVGLTLAACPGQGGLFAPPNEPGVGGGPGGAAALVGSWQVTLVITVSPDVQTWTTAWTFAPDRSCRYRQVVVSLLEGTERVRERTCQWRTANAELHLTWADTGASESLPYSFAAFDPGRLLLQGVEYRRIGGA